ncbi:MAG TPA: HemK/PrmC family methyltransferase [Gemmatimonadota bacterium]|nr:HemK/PrmC family methyltransferase [Gemmatimonadota bacterium]
MSPRAASRRGSAPTAGGITIGSLLDEAERRLEEREVEFPDTSALWLMSAVVGALDDPDALTERRTEPVDAAAEVRFREFLARREAHEPYQYIVGVSDFRDVLMEVESGVFVPRSQSERLCDEIEEWAESRPRPKGGWRIAELGAGCGAIAVSLALGPLAPRRVWAVDVSLQALELVRRNARRHKVEKRVVPLAGDWLEWSRAEPRFDMIVAVPPYLNPGDEIYLSEESLRWEPMDTFFGEPSGDDLLRGLADAAGRRLRPGGLFACQIDSDQVEMLEEHVNGDPDHPLTIEWVLADDEDDEDAILAVRTG